MPTREKAGLVRCRAQPCPRLPPPCQRPNLAFFSCCLQVRAGRVELGADGRSLEIHYEVSGRPANQPCVLFVLAPFSRVTCSRLLQRLELTVLDSGQEVVQTTKQGVKR